MPSTGNDNGSEAINDDTLDGLTSSDRSECDLKYKYSEEENDVETVLEPEHEQKKTNVWY